MLDAATALDSVGPETLERGSDGDLGSACLESMGWGGGDIRLSILGLSSSEGYSRHLFLERRVPHCDTGGSLWVVVTEANRQVASG